MGDKVNEEPETAEIPTDAQATHSTGDQTDATTGQARGSAEPENTLFEKFVEQAEEFLGFKPESLRDTNRKKIGQITLHYPSRDVQLLLDGDSAIRLLTMFREGREGRWSDPLHPFLSSADSGWLVLDLGEPLAISYMPLADKPKLTALDPAVTVA